MIERMGRSLLLALLLTLCGAAWLGAAPESGVSPGQGLLLAQATENEESSEEEEESEEGEEGDEEEEEDGFDDEFDDEFDDPAEQEVFDPLSGYNRVMTGFNDWFYTWVLDPTARGYRWVVPEGGRRAVGRFFKNLLFPVRFVNNALQAKFKNTGEETGRFVINSTVGLFGFFDPAKSWFGLERHQEDFGQTLGHYGVGGGFHLVLPLLGPSNLRDSLSLYPDFLADPTNSKFVVRRENGGHVLYGDSELAPIGTKAVEVVNYTSLHIGEYENLKKDALDLYPFLREVYEQNRNKNIAE